MSGGGAGTSTSGPGGLISGGGISGWPGWEGCGGSSGGWVDIARLLSRTNAAQAGRLPAYADEKGEARASPFPSDPGSAYGRITGWPLSSSGASSGK